MGAARRRLVTAVVTAAIVVASAAIPAPATEGRQVPHRWRPAVSQTRVDSKYPQAGDPRVDALHYRLGLRWAPATRTLTGHEALLWRATRTMRTFALDLSPDLRLRSVRLDGHRVVHTRRHHKLHLHARVRRGSVHRLVLVYAGVPHGVRGGPIPGAGAQVTPSGGLWTCQPPYGAFTWYAVNDQPADKAYYDFRLAVPRPLVGVANGRLIDRHRHGRLVRTRWHLDAPASSYLTTLGFGRYMHTSLGRVHGTPVSLWTPRGDAATRRKFRYAAPALRWLEHRLGPYPFATLGILSTRNTGCGMETQTMITLGDSDYTTHRNVIVHEIAHQWYGDLTTPNDWRDLWMSEGMAYYLQKIWEARHAHRPLEKVIAEMVPYARVVRRQEGPPGDYDPRHFAYLNVYDGPAIMWDELRKKLGNREFWRLVRRWPHVHAEGNASRRDLVRWFDCASGRHLDRFFHRWIMAPRLPRRS